ncbi:OmpA family protein [Roseospira marina]|uniref:OmpA family protein n=1 Tax=Roseospira marina TaxID=140057 RepID=A0A5M6IH82_9PROT|nr:flagellar motor protein MotB [Roseospira marina]KAA5607594.1 OmpA family protein [Roseospira marina]MBB4312212.1 chemotaxis protein MotB [Roseospira marina]MBB5085772.1 chemotaxis protein MotB [Roseospira marina]
MAEEKNAVIIKRVKKGGHGHHGGAWKVAYADFVTAMMAFFLLLWLLNSVTEEQLEGISNYFAPTAVSSSTSGAGGMLGGQVVGQGANQSMSASPTAEPMLPPPTIGLGGNDFTDPAEGLTLDETQPDFPSGEGENMGDGDGPSDETGEPAGAEEAAREAAQEASFDETAQALRQAIQAVPDLEKFQDSLMIAETEDGLKIQLLDQDRLAMFPGGSSAMYEHTRLLLGLVANAIKDLPNQLLISGHTDAAPFTDPTGYSNWELSADRALASRRVLLSGGIDPERIDAIIGKAGVEPLLPESPNDPRNRRIDIVLLRDADLYDAAQAERIPVLPSVLDAAPADDF